MILLQLLRGFFILARLKISVYLVVVLLAVNIAAKAIGSLQPPNPALRGFTEGCEDTPQPCWYGIVPGVTTVGEAKTTIENLNYSFGATMDDNHYFVDKQSRDENANKCPRIILSPAPDNSPVETLYLDQCPNLTLGDLTLIGSPRGIFSSGYEFIRLEQYYSAFTFLCAGGHGYYHCKDWSPTLEVDGVLISSNDGMNQLIGDRGWDWHGFAPKWRHCQLAPESPECLLIQ